MCVRFARRVQSLTIAGGKETVTVADVRISDYLVIFDVTIIMEIPNKEKSDQMVG